MATGSDIVTDALAEIGVFASETAIEADDMQLGIRKLNDMLISWNDSGTNLGFIPILNEADTVRVPRGANRAVIVNLAVLLAAPFGKQISQTLLTNVEAANKEENG